MSLPDTTSAPWSVRLAQVVAANPGVAMILLPVALSALLGYLMYFGITTTIPRLQESFHQEIKAERLAREADAREQRAMFRDELRMQREHDQEQTDKVISIVSAQMDEIRRIKLAAPKP